VDDQLKMAARSSYDVFVHDAQSRKSQLLRVFMSQDERYL
jgi:hypothetical protein